MILGISINDKNVYVTSDKSNQVIDYPFCISRNKDNTNFIIGNDVIRENKESNVLIVDDLLKLIENEGVATLGQTKYSAKMLIGYFFKTLFMSYGDIEYVTIAINKFNYKILNVIKEAIFEILIDYNKFRLISFSEAFDRYVSRTDESFRENSIGLIDFTNLSLKYYELNRIKSSGDFEYWVVDTNEYEPISIDIINSVQGVGLCDSLIKNFAVTSTQNKVYSGFIITGEGFVNYTIYREFMNYISSLTNVASETYLYAKGALIYSEDRIKNLDNNNIIHINDSRIFYDISLNAKVNFEDSLIDMIYAGEEWFYINKDAIIIVENDDDVSFEFTSIYDGNINNVLIRVCSSQDYKLRKNRTNKFNCHVIFIEQNRPNITIEDIGFGDFYEARHKVFQFSENI